MADHRKHASADLAHCAKFGLDRSNSTSVPTAIPGKWPLVSRLSKSLKVVGADTNRLRLYYDFLLGITMWIQYFLGNL